jgi:hypothetical protein
MPFGRPTPGRPAGGWLPLGRIWSLLIGNIIFRHRPPDREIDQKSVAGRRRDVAPSKTGNKDGGFLSDLPPLTKDDANLKSKHSAWLGELGFDVDEKSKNGEKEKLSLNGRNNQEPKKDAGGKGVGRRDRKSLTSQSDVSDEIPESVEELTFESEDDDLTTDKTFSDPDTAFKKLDYTENVSAII